MRHTIGALLGALCFILAYAYYTVAGLSCGPGGDGGRALLEFGTAIGLIILMATVLGACLAPPPKAPVTQAEPPRTEKPTDR